MQGQPRWCWGVQWGAAGGVLSMFVLGCSGMHVQHVCGGVRWGAVGCVSGASVLGCSGVQWGVFSVSMTQAPRGTASLRACHRHGNRQAISDNCARRPGNGAK